MAIKEGVDGDPIKVFDSIGKAQTDIQVNAAIYEGKITTLDSFGEFCHENGIKVDINAMRLENVELINQLGEKLKQHGVNATAEDVKRYLSVLDIPYQVDSIVKR